MRRALSGAQALGVKGLNVTVPHKNQVAKYLDSVTPEARLIGAVNTIVFQNGKSYGDNTDHSGFAGSLEFAKKELRNAEVLIFGAGGSARAAVYALMTHYQCRRIIINNRTKKNTIQLIRQFSKLNRSTQLDLGLLKEISGRQFQLIINATSVGLNSETSLVQPEFFRKDQLVYDLIYNPIETTFLRHAKSAGAKTVNGIEMLIRQAAEAFRIWTGRAMPLDAVRPVLQNFIANILENRPI